MNSRILLVLVIATVTASGVARAQGTDTPPVDPAAATNSAILGINGGQFGTVEVYLRGEDGPLLPRNVTATIDIVPVEGGTPLRITPQMVGEGWLLNGVVVGNDYKVQVMANGYFPAEERVHLANKQGASSIVTVLMRPISEELVFHAPTGQFVLAPRAEKEIQHALQDLQSGRVASAQKHTRAAIQVSPGNPYAQYVMGLSYLIANNIQEARPYLERSVSIDAGQPFALKALGTVRYRSGDNAGAVSAFEKAVRLGGTSWKTEWLLALSYFGERNFAESREHAEQALRLGGREAGEAQLVLGQALAGLGQREAAAEKFDAFVAAYPSDPNAPVVAEWAKTLHQPAQPLPANASRPLSVGPPVEVPPHPDWAPPDVDAAKPSVVSDAVCPLAQVLETAGKNAEQLVSNLQEFTATEDFQDVEIRRGGQVEKPSEHAFRYLVFIEQVSPRSFDVKESRDNGSTEVELPVRIADTGVPALALAFHPFVQPGLDWKCEGLGTWNSQPAWVIHFQQKPEQPNLLARFKDPVHSYALPLKGRAWVSERNGQVLHLETDLLHEIENVDLKREHYSIDYEDVSFHAHNVDLWLPESVDTYIQYRGHFLHYYHRFRDFKLFWVGASQKIEAPKNADQHPQQQP